MNSFSKSILFLFALAALGTMTLSPCWSQQSDFVTGSEAAEMVTSKSEISSDASSLPFEDSQDFDATDISVVDPEMASAQVETDCDDCQTCEGYVLTDPQLFPEVKNVNFFGVDRETCCDEWSGLCKMKSLKFGCNCGGLKANKGHLGLGWLRGRSGGEGCDYCNGGCCDTGSCDKGSGLKDCLAKCCLGKRCGGKSCSCQDKPAQRYVFGRPVEGSCQECGCCEKACPPEEGCESCK